MTASQDGRRKGTLMQRMQKAKLPAPPTDISIATCLQATDVIDADHPTVRTTAVAITKGTIDPVAKAKKLFYFVRDEIIYNFAPRLRSRDDWKASATLARGNGFCQQKAVLLAALARAVGIPSQLALQHLRDEKLLGTRYEPYMPGGILPYHGLTVLYLNGHWLWEDATLDAALCNRQGYRPVVFSATEDALLPSTDLSGQPHFHFLAQFGPYPDLPIALSDAFINEEGWEAWEKLVQRTHITM